MRSAKMTQIKTAHFSILKVGFAKFFDSHMLNYIGKLKMIKWKDLIHTVKTIELFSPAALAS